MIDTVRFLIPFDPFLLVELKEKTIEHLKVNKSTKEVIFRVFSEELELGSFDSNINIFYSEKTQRITLEFSICKVYFGHNINLFPVSQYRRTIKKVHDSLRNYFSVFPEPSLWELMRLDICYNWRYESEESARSMLSVLRSYKFARKEKQQYSESLMEKGQTYSLKFYLKYPEFLKHDYKRLIKQNRYNRAYNLAESAKGILRFEVTIRKEQLQYLYKRDKIYSDDINNKDICRFLDYYFNKYMKRQNTQFMNVQEVYNRLVSVFSEKKAMKLWEFYLAYHHEDKEVQNLLLKRVPERTIYYNLQQLRIADVGLYNQLPLGETKFSFPSFHNPNNCYAVGRRQSDTAGVL